MARGGVPALLVRRPAGFSTARQALAVFSAVLLLILSGAFLTGCRPKVATTLPPEVTAAVAGFTQGDEQYSIERWMAADGGYYLVELHMSPTDENIYLWVSADGETADMFLGVAEYGTLASYVDGEARVLCTRVGDAYSAFPYYEISHPGKTLEEKPFFKTATAGLYTASGSGLAYDLKAVDSTATSLDLLFMITGAEPGGGMAGGPRPPLCEITETPGSPGSVTLRLSYVALGPGTLDAIRGFDQSSGKVTTATWVDGRLEVTFSVPWKYSVSFAHPDTKSQSDDTEEPLSGYRISFLAKADDPDADGETLHQAAASASGFRIGTAEAASVTWASASQERILRAFPVKQDPASSPRSVDFAILIDGQWKVEKGGLIETSEGKGSRDMVRWRGQWYEVQ